jgi:arsenite methyltransferase
MSSTLDFDDKAARQIDAIYATPDVAATRVTAFRAVNPRLGERALDIGCGPGYLLRDLAAAVGNYGEAVGIDISEPMLDIARRRCADLGNVRLENTEATRLPLADGGADFVCAVQVYAYVKELDGALAELRRVLRPGGRAVVLDTDFSGVVWESRDRTRMRTILTAYDAHVAWPDLPRILPRRLRAAGLRMERCEVVPILTVNYHPNAYIHGLARFIRRFVVDNGSIPPEEADAWLAEFDSLEADGAFMFAINRFLFLVSRA